MAMHVKNNFFRARIKLQRPRLAVQQSAEEFLEEKTSSGDFVRVRQVQFTIIFHEHRVACGLKENDGRIIDVLVQQREVMTAQTRDFIEVALAERGAAAAPATSKQFDLKTGGFEDGYRGHSNLGFVIAHEGVVPQNHASAGRRVPALPLGEPAIKSLPGEVRQFASGRDAQKSRSEKAHD